MAATTTITSTYTDISGVPEANSLVVATLIGPTSYSGGTVAREIYGRTDSVGNWSISLYPNILFAGDSYYIIRLGNKEQYTVRVPSTTDTIQVTDLILQEAPQINFNGDMALNGNVMVRGNVYVAGNVYATHTLQISEDLAANDPTFWCDLVISGSLKVTGTLYHSGNLTYAQFSNVVS